MKIGQSNTLWEDPRYQRRRVEDISRAVNGALDFGDPKSGVYSPGNMSGTWVNITTPATANTTFIVHHNLGRIPQGMLVFSVDQPGAVIHSVNKAQWTKQTAQFQCNVGSVSLQGFVS